MVAKFSEPNTHRMQLRCMTTDDLPVVAEIDQRAYSHPWTLGIFKDCLNAGYGALVLCQNDTVIGYGLVTTAVDESHLLNVCIDPSHQGHGHGRYLTKKLMELGRMQGGTRMFLEVRESNLAAIMLYRSMGFNTIATRKDYYPAHDGREHAIIMQISLV